jgi:hypothetical protein
MKFEIKIINHNKNLNKNIKVKENNDSLQLNNNRFVIDCQS